MSEIDVITVCDGKTSGYARTLVGTAELLKSNKHQINWFCVTLDDCKIPKIFTRIEKPKTASSSGYKHAACLYEGLKVTKSPYTIITDIDVSILLKSWDNLLIKKLSDKTPIAGFEWGSHYERECYQNFPCVVFSLFDRKIFDSLDINLYQGTDEDPSVCTTILKDQKEAEILGHKQGDKLLLETAWQMPIKYKCKNYQGYCLQKIVPLAKKQSRKSILINFGPQKMQKWMAKKAKSGSNVMHEFFLDNQLFAVHLRRSRKYPSDSRMGLLWNQKIMQYMNLMNHIYFNPENVE